MLGAARLSRSTTSAAGDRMTEPTIVEAGNLPTRLSQARAHLRVRLGGTFANLGRAAGFGRGTASAAADTAGGAAIVHLGEGATRLAETRTECGARLRHAGGGAADTGHPSQPTGQATGTTAARGDRPVLAAIIGPRHRSTILAQAGAKRRVALGRTATDVRRSTLITLSAAGTGATGSDAPGVAAIVGSAHGPEACIQGGAKLGIGIGLTSGYAVAELAAHSPWTTAAVSQRPAAPAAVGPRSRSAGDAEVRAEQGVCFGDTSGHAALTGGLGATDLGRRAGAAIEEALASVRRRAAAGAKSGAGCLRAAFRAPCGAPEQGERQSGESSGRLDSYPSSSSRWGSGESTTWR